MSEVTALGRRRRRAARPELVLSHARLVLADEVIEGSLQIMEGGICAVDHGKSGLAAALDLEGDFLVPGLVELHTDSLEKHYQPRAGVQWDAVHAAISHDTQIIGSGITTVFDSIAIGAAPGWDPRSDWLAPMLRGLGEACGGAMLKAEHRLHLRCEVTHPQIVDMFEHYAASHAVRFMSLMDHAPGDRQSPDVDAYRRACLKYFDGDAAAVEAHIAGMIHASRTFGAPNRRRLAEVARAHGVPLASHDDARPEHIEEAAALGAVLSEFPTTVDAAHAAREHALQVLMGAPNLIRGGSHSGNVAAGELARRRLLDILSSDYIPASLLLGAFRLTHEDFGFTLPAAMATVTRHPAEAAGLEDRGRIAPDLRADLVQVREVNRRPVVRAVWRGGQRVA